MPRIAGWIVMFLLISQALTACGKNDTSAPAPSIQGPTVRDVNVRGAHDLIAQNGDNPSFVILDVRTPEEFAAGHLADALNINFRAEDFRDQISTLDRIKTYLVYCRTGHRSAEAARIMREKGFPRLYNLSGGIKGWLAAGFPTVK